MITLRHKLLASITRNYPFMSGCLKVADLGFFKKITGMPVDKVWADVPGGKVNASLNELMGRTAFYLGDLDKRLTWISRKLINPGDIVIDVGANIGIMTLLFSKLTGSKGQVFSFEPNPLVYEDLKAAISRNNCTNVVSYMNALGEDKGELILSVPESNLGLGTLVRASSEKCSSYNVKVTTLTDFAASEGFNRINFLKVDVEGFEHQVLLGAKGLFRKCPPDFLMFELNNFEGKAKDQPVIKFLKEYHYKFISIPKCLFKMYTAVLDENKGSFELGNDVIAVQPHVYQQALEVLLTHPKRI